MSTTNAAELPRWQVGTVKWFNDAKGFGFIATDAGSDVFVRYDEIQGGGFRFLRPGMTVRFELRKTARGARALRVAPLGVV